MLVITLLFFLFHRVNLFHIGTQKKRGLCLHKIEAQRFIFNDVLPHGLGPYDDAKIVKNEQNAK